MISVDQLDKSRCHLCHETFKDLDDLCTISNDTYLNKAISTNYTIQNPKTCYVVLARIYFHRRCFEIIAGEEFIP